MSTHVLDTIDPELLGDRITEARRARGLTQEAVAASLGVARTTITAMEKGERKPRAFELVLMAQLFGSSVGELVRADQPTSSPDFVVQFRASSKSDAASPERLRDIRRFEQVCRWYAELIGDAGLSVGHSFPDEYRIQGVDLEQAAVIVASSERNRLGLGDGPIGDLWDTLETDVGLWLFGFPMEDRSVSGMFLFSSAFGGCIAVNGNHPPERQHWTLAHEYAHFLTDRSRPEIQVLGSSRRKQPKEQFADAFAWNFLMPAAGLGRRFADLQDRAGGSATAAELLHLSHVYRVSAEAMSLRLEGLGLLPRGTWDELKARVFRANEAKRLLGLELESENQVRLPARYVSLAISAMESGDLSEGELAERLLTDRLTARKQVLSRTTAAVPVESGDWLQMRFDLSEPLVAMAS